MTIGSPAAVAPGLAQGLADPLRDGHLLAIGRLLDLLEVDNTIEPNDLQEKLGIDPVPFAPEELLYLKKITAGSAIRSLFQAS